MPSFHQLQMERFLHGHQVAVTGLIEQAYAQAGGHYARMTAGERRQLATTDAEEFITDLLNGVDRVAVKEIAYQAAGIGIAVDDLVRMAGALEDLFIAYICSQLVGQPVLVDELVRRTRNTIATFRANLIVGRADVSIRHFDKPPAG